MVTKRDCSSSVEFVFQEKQDCLPVGNPEVGNIRCYRQSDHADHPNVDQGDHDDHNTDDDW